MAVIIREKRILEDGTEVTEKVYRSSVPPSAEHTKQAKRLDSFLAKRMTTIAKEMRAKGLLEGKKGDRERWYELGKNIANFVDDPKIVLPEDRKQDHYIWIALEQNSPKDLHPNKEIAERKNSLTKRNHFRLAYILSKFPFSVVKQQTWREWVEILESPSILEDDRILWWLRKKMGGEAKVKLRPLARALRQELKDMYTKVLSEQELNKLLDDILDNFQSEYI
jgi:hypothetical protein